MAGKVLFIAYDFPPCRNIGGSLRSEKFVKYLPEFGWHPTIISLGPVYQSELYSDVHRVSSITPWHRPYELTSYGWAVPLLRAARSILQADPHHVIYASFPPFGHANAIEKLKKETGLPLVLDFRDAWSLDPYMEGSRLKKLMYQHVFPSLEARLLHAADRIILNTPSALKAYFCQYPELAGRFRLLSNGYDEEDFNILKNLNHCQLEKKLVLTYLGRFGIGDRRPEILFDALKILSDQSYNIILRIIGHNSENLFKAALARNVQNYIEIQPEVPHSAALAELYKSDVAVLYQENSRALITPVAGKTHEYLRSGKPILAIAPPGDNLRLLERMAGCIRSVPQPASGLEIARAIKYFFELKSLGLLPQYSSARKHYLHSFSRRNLSLKLAQHFDALS